MPWKRKLTGSTLAFIGFMLSPLSWWNDLFVNVPLALAFAWVVSLFWPAVFGASFVLGYWLTNVLGLVLMQKGAQHALSEQPKPEDVAAAHRALGAQHDLSEQSKPYSRRQLIADLGISLAYTLLLIVLVKYGVLKPLPDYMPKHTP